MNKWFVFMLISICLGHSSFSQDKFIIQNKKQSDKVKFKLINNLIVIPVDINGIALSFILDTGLSKPIIFNFLNVKIKDTETIELRGLGGGESVEASKSSNNILKIGDAIKLNQDLYAVYNSNLNLAPRLGIPIHGIIGLDVFKDLIVEINYSSGFLRLTTPEKFKYKACKKCERLNLEFYSGKPYVNTKVEIDNKAIPVKLLVDSGSSDSLWLFENDSLDIKSGEKFFVDFLGHGLNGSVYGKRSKIQSFSLNSFVLKNANVAFPNTEYIYHAKKVRNRNGSIGGNILKRFNIIFNYQKAFITITKNRNFKDKFNYNKSGIELAHDGFRAVREIEKTNVKVYSSTLNTNDDVLLTNQYKLSLKPTYIIVELREDSPANTAGLRKGDIVLSINGEQSHRFTLHEVMQMFYDDDGKKLRLRVDRDGEILNLSFKLQKLF